MVSAGEIETFSARIDLTFEQPASDVQTVVAELLQQIGVGCHAAGASLIGHIKCYGEISTGEHSGEYLHGSLTSLRSGVSCRGNIAGLCESIDLDLNVLVYGLPHETIDATVRSSLEALSHGRGMAFTVESNETHHEH